jgi:hypothetical protein
MKMVAVVLFAVGMIGCGGTAEYNDVKVEVINGAFSITDDAGFCQTADHVDFTTSDGQSVQVSGPTASAEMICTDCKCGTSTCTCTGCVEK